MEAEAIPQTIPHKLSNFYISINHNPSYHIYIGKDISDSMSVINIKELWPWQAIQLQEAGLKGVEGEGCCVCFWGFFCDYFFFFFI